MPSKKPLSEWGQKASNYCKTHEHVMKWMFSNVSIRGMFEMNCLFLSGDFKFQVSLKVLISCPPKYSPWLEMQSFSRCIHFLKASRYADLGTVIRYWWMADRSACRDWYFRPARNAFNFGNKKKSHGARSGDYEGWGKTVTFSFFKNAVTIAEVWAGALSCRRWTCLKPVAGRRFW